jgi:hypothetical protein
LTEAVLLGQPQRRDLGVYQILRKNGLERRLSLETPQMNMKMAEVTAAVFNAKKNILRQSQRMAGSDAGVVRNGPTTNCTGCLRRFRTILCVELVQSFKKLIFKGKCAYPIVPSHEPSFAPTPGEKVYLTPF